MNIPTAMPTRRRLFLGMLCAVSAAAMTSAPDPTTASADEFFGPTKVWMFHLTISKAEWAKMQPPNTGRGGAQGKGFGGDGYTKGEAKVEFEGRDMGMIAARFKGNSS